MESNKKEFQRMSQWLLIAICFYSFAIILAAKGIDFFPQVQTISWKLGHETIAAFLGYWIDRTANRTRLNNTPYTPLQEVRRAIIIGSSMIAIAIGM